MLRGAQNRRQLHSARFGALREWYSSPRLSKPPSPKLTTFVLGYSSPRLRRSPQNGASWLMRKRIKAKSVGVNNLSPTCRNQLSALRIFHWLAGANNLSCSHLKAVVKRYRTAAAPRGAAHPKVKYTHLHLAFLVFSQQAATLPWCSE